MSDQIEFLSPVSGRFLIALLAAAIIAWLAIRIGSGSASKLSRAWPIYLMRFVFGVVLLLLLTNPVRVTEQLGSIEPAEVFMMLDASESMALGNRGETRWDQAVNLIRNSSEDASAEAASEISLFRFGRRLSAVESPEELGLKNDVTTEGIGISFREEVEEEGDSEDGEAFEWDEEEESSPANEPDTQMLVALRQILSRFGRKPPSAVVVFSDGRARDEGQIEQVADAFQSLKVPVHVVPIGDSNNGGDVALLSLVMPRTARKETEVHAEAFLRTYGFEGKQVQLKLESLDEDGKRIRRLATVPVTLKSGFQPVPVSFQTSERTQSIHAVVSELPGEVASDNNELYSELTISREKIRVLYLEGNRMRGLPMQVDGNIVLRGPQSYLSEALGEDEDIDCRAVQVSVDLLNPGRTQVGAFPQSVAELSSFDAIILSDVPRSTFTPKQLAWIEGWVRLRGGGFCMVGGSNSFGAGDWRESPVENMLPVSLSSDADFQPGLATQLVVDQSDRLHPFFRLFNDERVNRELLSSFPVFRGVNVGLLPKSNLVKVLAIGKPDTNQTESRQSPLFSAEGIRNLLRMQSTQSSVDLTQEFPAITVGQYGKGRTMAMPMPITGNPAEEFLKWGPGEEGNQYYSQFWRNVVYWLTENSYVGRRRLVSTTDKRYYGPGDKMVITASAFDENANETKEYRLVGLFEPQSFDNIESDYSIVRWPNNTPREEETDSPFTIWGERFEIPIKRIGGHDTYQIALELAETLPSGTANQSLRLELTAFEGNTQVDSTSVPIQILHDPFEQQNPFPNHDLLERLAEASGGEVLRDEKQIADLLTSLPVVRGAAEFTRAPVWSSGWLLLALVGLISAEWCFRRWIGLA